MRAGRDAGATWGQLVRAELWWFCVVRLGLLAAVLFVVAITVATTPVPKDRIVYLPDHLEHWTVVDAAP